MSKGGVRPAECERISKAVRGTAGEIHEEEGGEVWVSTHPRLKLGGMEKASPCENACFAFNLRSEIRRFYDLEGKVEPVFHKITPQMMTSETLVIGRFLRTAQYGRAPSCDMQETGMRVK